IRDHDRTTFEQMKSDLLAIAEKMNATYDEDRVNVVLKDQYYNMAEVIEKDMSIVTLAETAMKNLGITPKIEPVRGGTDGSKISFMGIPTPNIFAGGENMHGRFEFVSVQTMQAAVDTIIEIAKLNSTQL
ncbi:MAG: peptidase T, partial [Lactococcus sp.]|nr:peptidase T [Lactococcus sp.]